MMRLVSKFLPTEKLAGLVAVQILIGIPLQACAHQQSTSLGKTATRSPEPTPALLSVDRLQEDFILRQQITVYWHHDMKKGFDAVLQKQGATMTLVGLGPMGSVGFTLTQKEESLDVSNRTGQVLRFDPRHIIADIQRVLYPWSPAPLRCDQTCTFSYEVHQTRIQEYWRYGHLSKRVFIRLSDGNPERIVVRYGHWGSHKITPARVQLDNGWYGYRLEIATIEEIYDLEPK